MTNAHLHCAAFVEEAEAHRIGGATEANPYPRPVIAGVAWLARRALDWRREWPQIELQILDRNLHYQQSYD